MQTKIKLTKEQQQILLKIKRNHQSDLIRDRAQVILLNFGTFTIQSQPVTANQV